MRDISVVRWIWCLWMDGVSRTLFLSYHAFPTRNETSYCLPVHTHYLVSGVDVYLRLPRLGTNLENIEI